MRVRLILAVSLLTAAVTIASGSTAGAAAPAGCRANSSGIVEFCDHLDPTSRNRGAIGLLGDSVLLGSSPGMSTPSLPTMLAGSGWGPIRMTTSLGMRTYAAAASQRDASAFHWIARWKAAGFAPRAIAVNLGANHLGTCSWPNIAPCKAAIDQLLNEIDAQYPGITVWWAKVVHKVLPSGAYSVQMMGWNAALDQAAAERGNLVLWDWPSALANALPPIITDLGGIHPVSGAQYVQRSTLIAAHLDLIMPANFAGPRVTPPSLTAPASGFTPVPATVTMDTIPTVEHPRSANPLGFEAITHVLSRNTLPMHGLPDGPAVALSVTVAYGTGAGYLTFFGCSDPQPGVSNINFQSGVRRTAQVLAAFDADGFLCAYSSKVVDVRIVVQGVFTAGGLTFEAGTPTRALDTRTSGRATDLTVPVPASNAVAASIVVVGQSAGGSVTVYECGTPVPAPFTLSFEPDEVVAGSIFVATSASGTICVKVDANDSRGVDVVVDITGTFSTSTTGLRFSPVTATRLLDTRSGLGGWYGRQSLGQTLNIVGAPSGVEAISGTLTMVQPPSNSHLRAWRCGDVLPTTSVVNARGGLAAANNVTTALAGDLTLCVWSAQNTSTLFDVTGYWVRAAG